MGIYSSDINLNNYNIPIDESYFGITGALNAMIDMENNNYAIFESTIIRDFRSAGMFYQGYDEATLIAFNESTLTDFISKFKQIVMKIWEKIKSIFATFLRKIDSVIIQDNKKYLDRYAKEVILKDLSKLKYKIQKRQKEFDKLRDLLISPNEWTATSTLIFNSIDSKTRVNEIQESINHVNLHQK